MDPRVQQLWNEFHQKLANFIRNRISDKEAANDILMDVFLKVQLHLPKLQDSTKLTAWVFQITRNAITDYYRKKNYVNSPEEPVEILDDSFEQNYNDIFKDEIRKYINRLPEQYREALVLTELKGMSQIKLAEHLKISYSGAKSRVQRGREKLKELFLECCHIEADRFGNIVNYHVRPKCCNKN